MTATRSETTTGENRCIYTVDPDPQLSRKGALGGWLLGEEPNATSENHCIFTVSRDGGEGRKRFGPEERRRRQERRGRREERREKSEERRETREERREKREERKWPPARFTAYLRCPVARSKKF